MPQQQQTAAEQFHSVLPGSVSYPELQKKLNSTRNWLYIMAVIMALEAVYKYFYAADETAKWLLTGIDSGLAAIFTVLALVANKKPFAAFLTAFIIYGSVTILLAIADWHTLIDHIYLKVFFFPAMIAGMKTARDAQRLKSLEGL